ncbi:hypothetical protein Q3G72_011265 [Acer saccharum]|nr:hypothetical protein Q3G72_011265 [Acer saccharum]
MQVILQQKKRPGKFITQRPSPANPQIGVLQESGNATLHRLGLSASSSRRLMNGAPRRRLRLGASNDQVRA